MKTLEEVVERLETLTGDKVKQEVLIMEMVVGEDADMRKLLAQIITSLGLKLSTRS